MCKGYEHHFEVTKGLNSESERDAPLFSFSSSPFVELMMCLTKGKGEGECSSNTSTHSNTKAQAQKHEHKSTSTKQQYRSTRRIRAAAVGSVINDEECTVMRSRFFEMLSHPLLTNMPNHIPILFLIRESTSFCKCLQAPARATCRTTSRFYV